jgi:3-hydroxypropionyl-coenzyme A dehydratase
MKAKYIFKYSMNNIVLDLPFKDTCIIKINRPEVLNALDRNVLIELDEAIEAVSHDDCIKVVIITGEGNRSFCTGGDIRYVIGLDPTGAQEYATYAHKLLNKIEDMDKPVIAAINGYALGGGCQLALACDIRIASSNAKMGQTEVKVGIPPGWGGTQRLTRIIGMAKSKELIYTGKIITSIEAEKIGLVNKIVKLTEKDVSTLQDAIVENITTTTTTTNYGKDQNQPPPQQQLLNEKQKSRELSQILNRKLIEESISFAKEITKNSYNAIRISKALINKGIDSPIETGLCLEIYGMALSFAHSDRQKMMSAFLNKKL